MQQKNKKCSVEDNLPALSDLIADPVMIIDRMGKILSANQGVEDATGINPVEIIGKSFLEIDFLDKENKSKLAKNFADRMEGISVEPYEIKVTSKNGRNKYFETKGKKISYFGDQADLVVFHDITQRILKQEYLESDLEKKGRDLEKSEEKLSDSEEKYHKLFDEAIDAIFLAEAETGILVDCNQAAAKLLELDKSELIGKHQSFLHLEHQHNDQGKFTNSFKELLSDEKGRTVETQIVTKNGKIKEVAIKANILQLNGKKMLQGIFRDITERKKVENDLERKRQELNRILDSSPTIIFYKNKEGKFTLVNRAFADSLEVSKEELLGKTVSDMYPHKIAEDMINDDIEVMKSKRTRLGIIEPYESPRGLRWIRTDKIPSFDENGVVNGLIGFSEDITERKKAENKVRRAQEKYQSLCQNIPGMVYRARPDWSTEIISNSKNVCGYTIEELNSGRINWLNLIHPNDKEKVVAEGASMRTKPESITQEYRIIDKGGNVRWVEDHKISFFSGNGVFEGVDGVVFDSSQRKELAQKLQDYSQHLEELVDKKTEQLKETQKQLLKIERLAAIGELAGMVGHDLRNPLTGIKNAAYFLKKKGATIPESEAKAMLEIIEKGIDHSDKIINDLLDYAREMHVDLQQIPMPQLLGEALAAIKIPEKIRVQKNIPEALSLKFDANKIERVFINLIKNAIDAMPNGGTLTIDCKQTDCHVEISFSDTGTGIPEEILPKLFTPLFTTKAQGMGFGLAICKRIIEAHEGTIKVETENGKGTTFTITLPTEPKIEIGGDKVWINIPESSLSTTTKAYKKQ